MKKNVTIALDVDGVIADLVGALCRGLSQQREYNHEIRALHPEDIKVYNIDANLNPDERRAVHLWSQSPGFCASLPWYEAGQTFVRTLQDMGEVFAVTAPWRASTWAKERADWLSPVIDKAHVISCPSEAKPWACAAADVFIEDRADTLAAWLHRARPGALAILIDRPWNRSDVPPSAVGRIHRVRSYGEAARLVHAYVSGAS